MQSEIKAPLTISIDAMGGSGAPLMVVEALAAVMSARPDVHFLLSGNQSKLEAMTASLGLPHERYSIIDAKTVITDSDKPVDALRNGRESSMRKSIDMVQAGAAQACISAGNTGALMVMAKMILGTMPGIERPAIAGLMPGINPDGEMCHSVLLDLGANTQCNEKMLQQFAIMGACVATVLLGKPEPSIGVLNIGTEETKGRDLEQKVHSMLKESKLNFIGYIEGHDINRGIADVVVTDGFSGNLVLKSLEGAARMFVALMRQSFKSSLWARLLGLLTYGILRRSLSSIHPDNNNGGMMVGLNGVVVKAHGSSSVQAFSKALLRTIDLVSADVNGKIRDMLSEVNGHDLNVLEKIKVKIFGHN